jgi:uncharacterized protein (TIGR00730 family)
MENVGEFFHDPFKGITLMLPDRIKNLAVFCGSSPGKSAIYRTAMEQFANDVADRNLTIIYGGATVGLMGTLANSVLKRGGKVIGVIPQLLVDVEISHKELTELHIVPTMHERKTKIYELADGFMMLPGGPGSLEEFFEIYTWAKLGYHAKPCGILNQHGFYTPLIEFIDHCTAEEFLSPKCRAMILIDDSFEALLKKFNDYVAPTDTLRGLISLGERVAD